MSFTTCRRCELGNKDICRFLVRNDAVGRSVLFHAHHDEMLQGLLLRLCELHPDMWTRDMVYYFYVDFGGTYYPIEDARWLRDMDQVLVTPVAEVSSLPDVSMSAIHAALRDHVKLEPYQEEGIQKMIRMELDSRGGILADDMGLGKTLQMLTLILRQQPKMTIRAPTLVVVPSHGVADQWAEEIRTKTTYGSLPYFIYQEETRCLLEQPCFRVVITTYDRLRMEHKNRFTLNMPAPLIDTQWHRVVLDESIKIRAMRSKATESVLELRAKFRWCLTGTPLQNDISELYPIFAFLRIPLSVKDKQDVDLITSILQKNMIRRTKRSLRASLTILPQREERVVLVFSDAERALYDYLERLLYHQISRFKSNRDQAGSASALLYLRLKQACSHHQILLDKFPNLIPMAQRSEADEVIDSLNSTDDEDDGRPGELNEVFSAIESFYDQFGNTIESPDMNAMQKLPFLAHSTKTKWLISFLRTTLRESPTNKVVVVSQFVDLLERISSVLTSIHIKHGVYHGDVSAMGRRLAKNQFSHQSDMRVLLLSLKAGGIGLNFEAANHMVILDRWWNPATMDQAVARIHRMTQSKQTFVHTLVIKNTLEQDLMDGILTKKSQLFSAIVDRD